MGFKFGFCSGLEPKPKDPKKPKHRTQKPKEIKFQTQKLKIFGVLKIFIHIKIFYRICFFEFF